MSRVVNDEEVANSHAKEQVVHNDVVKELESNKVQDDKENHKLRHQELQSIPQQSPVRMK